MHELGKVLVFSSYLAYDYSCVSQDHFGLKSLIPKLSTSRNPTLPNSLLWDSDFQNLLKKATGKLVWIIKRFETLVVKIIVLDLLREISFGLNYPRVENWGFKKSGFYCM